MTDLEIDPSLLPDAQLPFQDNTMINAGAHAGREPTPVTVAPEAATSVAGEDETYPFTEGVEGGKPRTRVVVQPRLELRTDAPDESTPNGTSARERGSLQRPREASETKPSYPSVADDVDPVDRLVESVFPTTSLTDWMLADPLRRWDLFQQAIAEDPAGVDAAVTRAREVGYTASRFTDALKTLAGTKSGTAASGEVAPPIPVSEDRSSGSTWAQSLITGMVPGAHYATLAQQQYRQGNYGSAAIYGVTSALDAAIGIASLGASTRIGAASRSARSLAEESFHYTFSHALSSLSAKG